MVRVYTGDACVDSYEVSIGSNGRAVSEQGQYPDAEKAQVVVADDACIAAGKHLCTEQEWLAACHGPPPGGLYPYGSIYRPDFCDGYDGTGEVVTTGNFPECEGGFLGLFDLAGNGTAVDPAA